MWRVAVEIVQTQRVRADNRKCRLTYWLNRRLCFAPTAYDILFQQPPRICTGQFPSCGGEMTSTDTLGRLHRVCTRRRSLTGWWPGICTGQFPSCGGEMSSTDTLGRLHRVCTRRRSLTGWWPGICTRQFPSCGGEMSSTDTLGRLHRVCTRRRSLTGWCSAEPPNSSTSRGGPFPSCGGEMSSTDTLGLLKKYLHHTNLTACAIEFMKR